MKHVNLLLGILVASVMSILCNHMDFIPPDSLSMEFSRQEYWSGLSFLSPENLPNPRIKAGSSALQVDSLPSEPPGMYVFFMKLS